MKIVIFNKFAQSKESYYHNVYKVVVIQILMEVKCPKCGYEWATNSELDFITCSNCQRKFKKEEGRKENEKK